MFSSQSTCSSSSLTVSTITITIICLFICINLTVCGTSKGRFTLDENQESHPSQHGIQSHSLEHDQGKRGSRVSVSRSNNVPHVGAFLKDFKGTSIKDFSTSLTSDIILPYLPVEDYVWEGFSLQLECNFTQPIQWIYAGDGAPAVKTDTYRIAPDIHNSSSYIYGASVIFTYTDYKQTGRYTCQSIPQPKFHSDLFVYVPGKKIFVSDNDEMNVTEIVMNGDAFSRWIKLPCSVSNPNSSVQLFKDGKEIQLTRKKIYFEPKIGFELSRDNLTNPWGKYQCLEPKTGQSLVIHVEPPKYILAGGVLLAPDANKLTVYSDNPFVENEENKALTHLKFHYDKRNELVMCCAFDINGQSLRRYPILKSTSCDSVNECSMIKKHLESQKCPTKEKCQGKKLKRHCVGYELTDFDDSGLLECSLHGYFESKEYFQFSKVGEIVLTDFDVIPETENILKIIAEDSSTASGIKLLTCQANSFFFARGIKWAFQNETNHDLTFLYQDFPANISIEIDPEEINTVYCFAPLWKSAEWRNISISYPYD